MNPYIEFAQWALAEWRSYWRAHGTKILGWGTTLYSAAMSGLAYLSADPDYTLLVTPGQFKFLMLVNIMLGGATIKRGHTNDRPPVPATP
jgi:hypothetical protein